MFLVVADDLTGAAEIGGVAWRYGLTAEAHLTDLGESDADVVIVDTDTRSLSGPEAARRIRQLAPKLRGRRVFKKVDSALRGPVAAEVRALLEATGASRAVLVPCNPSLGRTIERGQYWIRGVPIHETEFSGDPEYPARSPLVVELLRDPEVQVVSVNSELPQACLIVGEAACEADVAAWAARLDATTLAVGAASFFAAILEREGLRPRQRSVPPAPEKKLLVSGSASESSRVQIEALREQGVPVIPLPASCERVVKALQGSQRVVITGLSQPLALLTEEVLRQSPVEQLWIEGGATASALMRHLGWRKLRVIEEMAPGVVSLRAAGAASPAIVVKPGSYQWPNSV